MNREEVFVPSTRSQKVGDKAPLRKVRVNGMDLDELLEDAPIYRLYHIFIQQVRLLSSLPRPTIDR